MEHFCVTGVVWRAKKISLTCIISDEDQGILLIQSNIFVPKASRYCWGQVTDDCLINNDLNKIHPLEIAQISFSSHDILK